MPLCENCNESSPNPVPEVTVNQTLISLDDGTGVHYEFDETPLVDTTVFTLAYEFVEVYGVYLGGAKQAEDQYTIVGTTLTFNAPVPAGTKVLAVGIREV